MVHLHNGATMDRFQSDKSETSQLLRVRSINLSIEYSDVKSQPESDGIWQVLNPHPVAHLLAI